MPKQDLHSASKLAIYLAGSIKKGHEPSSELFWTDVEMNTLKKALSDFEISFLNPAFRTDDLSIAQSVFGRDMLMVFSSDFVLVDLRQRRGIGVGAEMMWAKFNNIPLISYAPRDTHYRSSNATILETDVKDYVHPFIESLSDYVAHDLGEAADWMRQHRGPGKGVSSIHDAVAFYLKTQYASDLPMQSLPEELKLRIESRYQNELTSSSRE